MVNTYAMFFDLITYIPRICSLGFSVGKGAAISTLAPIYGKALTITPVQKKIDPLKWRLNTRKNRDDYMET